MITATQKAHIRPVHPFPARMAPSIVWDYLPQKGSLRILDPMAGSGTTLVCAKEKGHIALGCDTDPLALLIAKTWCANIDANSIMRRAILVLERAKKLADQMKDEEAYPRKADKETRQFIDFWFDKKIRCKLTALSTCIARVKAENEKTILWSAFSRLIITKSVGASLAMDVSHSRPHKVYHTAPICPFEKYLQSVGYIVKNSPFQVGLTKATKNYPSVDIRMGDARKLPVVSNNVDMIITSPPYLNAIDYLRGHKLSLVWMGYSIESIRKLRSENIGSEKSNYSQLEQVIKEAVDSMGKISELSARQKGMLERYAFDMNKVLGECKRVLKKRGKAIFVVGDSSLNGVYIQNSECLNSLATNHGFSLIKRTIRPIAENRRYLPPPNSKQSGKQLQSRMKEEVILEFLAL